MYRDEIDSLQTRSVYDPDQLIRRGRALHNRAVFDALVALATGIARVLAGAVPGGGRAKHYAGSGRTSLQE